MISAYLGLWDSTVPLCPSLPRGVSPTYGDKSAVYDMTVVKMNKVDRANWALRICQDVYNELYNEYLGSDGETPVDPSEVVVEIHAGRDYIEPIGDLLRKFGLNIETPTLGLAIGKQLQFYKTFCAQAASGAGQ